MTLFKWRNGMRGTTYSSAKRRARRTLVSVGIIGTLAVCAAPAFADSPANAIGIAHSDGTAAVATLPSAATPPAYGQPADAGIGHKIG
jgi:hypothetical protein